MAAHTHLRHLPAPGLLGDHHALTLSVHALLTRATGQWRGHACVPGLTAARSGGAAQRCVQQSCPANSARRQSERTTGTAEGFTRLLLAKGTPPPVARCSDQDGRGCRIWATTRPPCGCGRPTGPSVDDGARAFAVCWPVSTAVAPAMSDAAARPARPVAPTCPRCGVRRWLIDHAHSRP